MKHFVTTSETVDTKEFTLDELRDQVDSFAWTKRMLVACVVCFFIGFLFCLLISGGIMSDVCKGKILEDVATSTQNLK